MNPLRYAHPVMSFVIPVFLVLLGGIGLPGGAVYINRHLLRSRQWETAVSLAGPAINVVCALVIAAVLRFYLIPQFPTHVGTYAIAFALQLEISAVLFNLIPMPPLDGFGAIEPWLSEKWRESLRPISQNGIFILFLAFWYVRPLNHAFWTVVYACSSALGVDPSLGYEGLRAFRFWQ
jgi:Zn-dependent protease